MIIGALMAAPSLTDGRLATEGLPYVLGAVLSSPWGTLLLVDVAIAIFICTLAIQTAATRLMFSMARDHRLPFSSLLSRVNPATGTPIPPAIVVGVACVGVLLVNVGNSAIFATLASVCIIAIYIAYLLVTAPLLAHRLRGMRWDTTATDAGGRPLFSLGRWGLPVNVFAVMYGVAMVINLAWPRPEIYDPTGTMPLLVWAGPFTIVAIVALGALCFPYRRTHPRPVGSL